MMGNRLEQEPTPSATMPIPDEVPILISRDSVLFPSITVPMVVQDEITLRIIDEAMSEHRILGAFVQTGGTDGDFPQPDTDNLKAIGSAVLIARMVKAPDGTTRLLLQGLRRIRLVEITQREPVLKARVEQVEERIEESTELEAIVRNLTSQFGRIVSISPNLPQDLVTAATSIDDVSQAVDFVAAFLNLSMEERQDVLEELDVFERATKVTHLVNRELEILELGNQIQSQMKEQMDQAQRDAYLRQQMQAIRKELGEESEQGAETEDLRLKLDEAGLPEEARKEADRELARLERLPPGAAEHNMIRTFLDWIIGLPWSKLTEDHLDLAEATRVLDDDHFGLEKVKNRILDYLAVRKLQPEMRGPILCFVGPPGVGKTSIGQSIARALGRKFVRLALGGIRDEAEIRGFRRTYIGASPGRILQQLRQVETRNPVFMLDEVDKIGADFRGDPSSALLEVLDPAQNSKFGDHYLEVPFDLSQVLFVATANVMDTIPPALRDRMEVIELSGYTEYEKVEIARRYLVPRQVKENGISEEFLEITDDALHGTIQGYTREAGVRNLEREIGTMARKVARGVAEGSTEKRIVNNSALADYLGPIKVHRESPDERSDEVGVATGLAWTQAGGETLAVEVAAVPGRGNLSLTGQLGDVMQESARAALTYARSRAEVLDIPEGFFEKTDLHVHIPAGAIPKDGPSAGVTMATALISAICKRPISKDFAMTGEVTLRGNVLPVGGVRDKVLAAHRAGIRKVIIPKDNESDIDEVPEQVRNEMSFSLVSTVDEVLKAVLKTEIVEEEFDLASIEN